jgi:phosphoribosylformylglycinamidine synthase
LGITRNELGASAYYAHFDYVGRNVPRVLADDFLTLYRALSNAIAQGRVASAHGIYRGGLGVHLAMVAMGGNLGIQAELRHMPLESVDRSDTALFSESAGRFIVTVDPGHRQAFEACFQGLPCACIGHVKAEPHFIIQGMDGINVIDTTVQNLKAAWKGTFGDLV